MAAIRRRLANNVAETAAAAHFAVSYGDGAYLLLHSDRRADAILLEALIADSSRRVISSPSSWRACSPTARPAAGRTRRRTSSSSSLSTAISRPTRRRRPTSWRAPGSATATRARTRSAAAPPSATTSTIPMPYLREGEGRDRSAPRQGGSGPALLPDRPALRAGQTSSSSRSTAGSPSNASYEAVDDPKDVQRDDDGTWRIRAGARVRVRLTMVAPSRRYHVALVDPLPAGLEPLNPALAVTGTVPADGGSDVTPIGAPGLGGPRLPGHWWWWSRPGSTTRTCATTAWRPSPPLLWEGVHTYRYVARATTPGHVRRSAAKGRGDVRPGDLRPRRDRPRHRRIGRTLEPAVRREGTT